jgi:argininosuccinate synthase
MNSNFGSYGEMNKGWSADDAKGYTKILSNQLKIFFSVNK